MPASLESGDAEQGDANGKEARSIDLVRSNDGTGDDTATDEQAQSVLSQRIRASYKLLR